MSISTVLVYQVRQVTSSCPPMTLDRPVPAQRAKDDGLVCIYFPSGAALR